MERFTTTRAWETETDSHTRDPAATPRPHSSYLRFIDRFRDVASTTVEELPSGHRFIHHQSEVHLVPFDSSTPDLLKVCIRVPQQVVDLVFKTPGSERGYLRALQLNTLMPVPGVAYGAAPGSDALTLAFTVSIAAADGTEARDLMNLIDITLTNLQTVGHLLEPLAILRGAAPLPRGMHPASHPTAGPYTVRP